MDGSSPASSEPLDEPGRSGPSAAPDAVVKPDGRTEGGLRRTARHEAAHAVAAWAMGATVTSISLRSDGITDGRCCYIIPAGMRPVDAAWATLVIAVSGNVIDHHATSICPLAVTSTLPSGQRPRWSRPQPPDNVTSHLTLDSLITVARGRAIELLAEHAALVDALTEQVLSHPLHRCDSPDLDAIAAGRAGCVR